MPTLETRLLFWDEKFSTKRKFTRAELFERYEATFKKNISIRTFRDDMTELRERNAPLMIDRFDIKNPLLSAGEKSHYFYTENFSLSVKQPLTGEDAELINQAVSVLKQFQYLPQFRDLETILFKLEHIAGIKSPQSKPQKEIIAFQQIPKLRGLFRLEALYEAIRKQQVLELFYIEFDQPNIQTLLHPYFLKQYNNRWYVYGFCENENKIRPYALDRIAKLSPTQYFFKSNPSFDFDTFFHNQIGISARREELVDTILLRVQQPRAHYMLTKPWHPSQTIIEETPQYMDFQFNVIINKELEAHVLEFGKDIEVLQPMYFRDKIRQILTEALTQYE